jgi:signal transduction histidine kinase
VIRRLTQSRWYDLAAGVLYFVAGSIDYAVAKPQEGAPFLNLLCVAAVAGAIIWRRRAPVAASAVFVVTIGLQGLFLTSPDTLIMPFFGLLFFPYAMGAYARSAWTVLIVPAIIAVVALLEHFDGDGLQPGDIVFPGALATAAWFAGRGVQSRTHLAAELHEAAVRAEEARETEASRAVAAERRRIAREMHDIVAHSISVMVVQAGGARRIIDREPGRAITAAEHIERTGREALVEMRRLLGVFKAGEHDAVREPQPRLDGLGALVGRAREAGLPVEVHEVGDRRPLTAGLDLTAYRILQEALTNAVKYAGAAPTEVRVRWTHDMLELSVADRGPGPAATRDRNGTAQYGLIGMRERVRLYGGEIHTGRRRGGGFEVRAKLPLQAEEATTA